MAKPVCATKTTTSLGVCLLWLLSQVGFSRKNCCLAQASLALTLPLSTFSALITYDSDLFVFFVVFLSSALFSWYLVLNMHPEGHQCLCTRTKFSIVCNFQRTLGQRSQDAGQMLPVMIIQGGCCSLAAHWLAAEGTCVSSDCRQLTVRLTSAFSKSYVIARRYLSFIPPD